MSVYKLIEVYLDYRNNYLSVQGYADKNELSLEFAKALIDEATKTYKSIYGQFLFRLI